MATNIRVLHVDDEPEFLSLTAEYLDRVNEHITIETATSAEGVLERLPDQEFDCIVSDYDMPGMDGIKLLKAVRDEHPDLPFILFTGKGSEEVASDAISAGVSDYLQKGGTERFELLANRIQNLVEQAESVRSLRRFRQIADAAGHAIYFTDSDGVIEYVNPAFEDITGYSAEEAIGSHPRILRSGEHGEEYHKEKWETILAGQVWEEEITNLRKSGDRYHAYQTIAPVRGEDGDMEAFVAIQSDITERKEHDRERIRYKDIFDQAQEIANLGAWEADLRRNEAWTSDQVNRIYGLPTDQEIGIGEGTEYFHPEDRPIIEQAFERAAQDCEPYDLELRINGADDTDRWVRAIGEPQVNGGDVTRIRGTFQDITERKARERQLRETNQRLELALEEADAGIWEWNVETDELYWSDELLDILGYSREEFPGSIDFLTETLHPDDAERTEEAIETSLQTGETYSVEQRIRTVRGEYRWLDVRGQVIEHRTTSRMVGVAFDITDHKDHEQDLERLRDFFTEAEQLGDLGAWEFDENNNIEWTAGTRRIHEVDPDYDPTLEDALDFFQPDDRARLEEAAENALATGKSYDLELRLTTARDNQRWVRTRGKVLDDAETRTVRGFIQDITDRKERERELQAAHAQLENAIDAGAIGTWEWHIHDDRLVTGREFARTFGVDPHMAERGLTLDDFVSSIHEQDRTRVAEKIEAAMAECGDYEAEYGVWDANDELRWVLARGHVRCDEDGTPVRFPGVIVDITDRKQMERQLQRQNERLDKFTSIVSHDLRNPLNVVGGRLELVAEECDSPHLEEASEALDRMEGLIDNLLTLARQGQTGGEPEPVDVAALIERCWSMTGSEEAELKLVGEGIIPADAPRLEQLFENLFLNAVEHGGSDVTVRAGITEQQTVVVEDDGPGIPSDDRNDIFEPGYSSGDSGTGFGLVIVEEIVEAHDWEIEVSESEQGGARFEITGVGVVE